jgi:diguanylate cyclase (GGDEF)-like protein
MARVFGTLFAFGGLVAILIFAFGETVDRRDWVLLALMGATIAFAATFFVVYRRLPIWFFQGSLALGSLIIAAGATGASPGAEGTWALCYVWVVVLAFLFFTTRAAVVQIAFGLLAYATALIYSDADFTPNYLIVMVAVLGTSGAVIGLLRTGLEQIAANLASEASTDPVTAVANRRGFNERFKLELGRARLTKRPLSLVICDLDRFKAVNDALGHEEGDRALHRAAAAISASVRSIDAVARLGGEEFSVLLPDAGSAQAFEVAERVRVSVLEAFSDYEVPLTTSCGIATVDDEDGRDRGDLFGAADAALYEAKEAGRNCTVVAGATGRQMRLESSTK